MSLGPVCRRSLGSPGHAPPRETIAQLDESLRATGLPVTKEVFELQYSSDADTEVTEAALVAEESPPK
jgi:hypothetical protein